jgi:DNA-binding transcriptional LysR family regulator
MGTRRHAYKDLQLSQLRGFCEAARLGSLSAAAAALGLTQPTVWEQVRSLERHFDATLLEAHGRGCRLTDDGRILVEMIAPLVAGIDALKSRFTQARGRGEAWLTIATTQRVLVEDLPEAIRRFEERHPRIRLRFVERAGDQVAAAVAARQADLGLSTERPAGAGLDFEPLYELDPILITPRDHPLARRRRLQPRDLVGFPLVNSAKGGFADPVVAATLDKLGVFQDQPQRVEAIYTAVIRRYVELGFGIGIVPGLPGRSPSPTLHERSLSRYFGRVAINLIWRRGAVQHNWIRAFAEVVKKRLVPRRKGRCPPAHASRASGVSWRC